MSEIIISIFNYLKSNPLAFPTFILGILSFIILLRKYKSSYAKAFFQRIPTGKKPIYFLKIYNPDNNQPLHITEIPKIYKKSIFYNKCLNIVVDYYHDIDQKTKEAIPNIYYIHFEQFINFVPGKYLLKIKVDKLPHTIRYKFTLPIIDPIEILNKN